MENIKGSSNIRNSAYTAKNPLLPPKIPFPSISPAYVDFVPNSIVGPRGIANPKEVNNNANHQRTSSESVLLEEQPSWLDDLLNEPDTPVRKGGHRRSSSDSFAYIDVSNASPVNHRNMISVPSWGSQDFERYKDVQHSFYPEPIPNLKNWAVDTSLGRSGIDNVVIQSPGSSSVSQESDGVSSTASQKQDTVELAGHDPKSNSELKDLPNAKASASDSDTKRAKQQFAQRSRVRKLQYIAELERSVQALQAEGSEISAELEFINQQNIILNMENKNLKQRLDSLAQEQLIKYLEHEMLEREVGRLRMLCQQLQLQHQQQPLPSTHRRTNSRDIDSQQRRINNKDLSSQFANLSLKQHNDNGSGPLNI